MDRVLYIAMAGARQTLLAQAVNSHNLANTSTVGFRATLFQARSMPVFGHGHPTRVFAMTESPGVSFDAGTIQQTGRDLDVAVNGDGWIAVQANDGSEAYTRAGDLRVSLNGLLETGAGYPVLGNAGPIAIPTAEKLDIAVDGTISVRPLGQSVQALAEVDRIKLVNPPTEKLAKGSDGLFRLPDDALAPPDANVRIVPGALEGSNVNAVGALVDMIALARRFELEVKIMQAAEENATAASTIVRQT